MYVIAAIIAAFLLPFVLLKRGVRTSNAWLASCCVVPAFVLFAEFVLPYSGGGASMWPIALFFGALWSAAAGALGTFIAARINKGEVKHDV
jgi:hypothetical protein